MKNIISLVVLLSSISFAQTVQSKSLIELKQISAVNSQQLAVRSSHYPSSIIHHPPSITHHPSSINHLPSSIIQYPVSSIQYPVSINHQPSSLAHPPVSSIQKKNPALAILYSMLLPGMGELYANSYESGKYFTIADGVLWGVFTGFSIYGNQQENNYKNFAQSRGGVKVDGKDADYFANIGAYLSLDDYNTSMELDRRFERTYNTSTHYWKWSSDDQRKEYRNMWTSSESAFTNVRFVVGALILNRVVSAINAVRLVSAYNKNLPKELSWNVYFDVENKVTLPQSLKINFVSRL